MTALLIIFTIFAIICDEFSIKREEAKYRGSAETIQALNQYEKYSKETEEILRSF